jgi:signal transduction histidine kinase
MTKSKAMENAPEDKGELPRLESAHVLLVNEARIGLILVAFLMVLLHPSETARAQLFLILALYAAYSYILLRRLNRGSTFGYSRLAYWVDVGAYAFVVILTGGLASDFFVFLLFPILVASFQWGFRRGVLVVVVCTLLFAMTGTLQVWLNAGGGWAQFSLEPLVVLLLGGLVVARWGKSEATMTRRLAFANDLNRLINPRYGLDRAMYKLAEMLCEYQRADACIVLMVSSKSGDYLLYEARSGAEKHCAHGDRIGRDSAAPLLIASSDQVVLFSRHRWLLGLKRSRAYDLTTLEPRSVESDMLEELSNLLEADSFISLPIHARDQLLGRIFLISSRTRYTRADVPFLVQVVGQAALVIENIRLLDRLALEVATEERRKISRDLHDGTIQPYIGLKLGLEALRRKLGAHETIAAEVEELTKIAADGISQLRRYVGGLRSSQTKNNHDLLLPAVRRSAEKFTEFYGIDVQVVTEGDIVVPGRLLDELMYIVREGLSNIRRHTSAECAVINLREYDGRLILEFINDNANGHSGSASFFPRSLNERAKELGGRVSVEQRPDGHTAVTVEIPR